MVRPEKRARKACSVAVFPKFFRFYPSRRSLRFYISRGVLGRVSRTAYVDDKGADVYEEVADVGKQTVDDDEAANDFDQEVAEKAACVDEKGADVDEEAADDREATDVDQKAVDVDHKADDVDQGEAEKAGDVDQQVPFTAPKLDSSKLVIEELKMGCIGNHDLKADFGSKVSVTCEYKSEAGELLSKDEYHELKLGSGRALHEGIRGMSLGDKRRLHIPSPRQSGGLSICEVTLTKVHK